MRICVQNRADGVAILRCERADGSVTWQRHTSKNSRYFPPHDLTHYAVESTLGLRHAFYGLVASGWDLSDFGTPWPRGPLPPEANLAEVLVGCLDVERLQGELQSAEEVNARGANQCGETWRPVSDEELARIRTLARELIARWYALPPDGEMVLTQPEAR